jgi:hypothetical protein
MVKVKSKISFDQDSRMAAEEFRGFRTVGEQASSGQFYSTHLQSGGLKT